MPRSPARSPAPAQRPRTPHERGADQALRASAGTCVCGNLRMAARIVTSMYDAALRPCGIEANQMAMLWACHDAGELRASELAHQVGMDPSTTSRNVAVLAAKGLVSCRPSTDDRRERHVRLTAKGRSTLARALPRWQAVQRTLGEATDGVGDLVAIGRQLRKATRLLQAHERTGHGARP